VKLPVTLQTDEVRELLAKPDLGEGPMDMDMPLHAAHCCCALTHQHQQHRTQQSVNKLLKNQQKITMNWKTYSWARVAIAD